MPVLAVRRVATCRAKQPVAFGEHRMMLRPREGHDQRLRSTALRITPEPADLRWLHAGFGNSVAVARFTGRATEFCFDSTARLFHAAGNALDFPVGEGPLGDASSYPFSHSTDEGPDLARSTERQYPDPGRGVDRPVRQLLRPDGPADTRARLPTITHAIRARFTYVPRAELGVQDPLRTLCLGNGSCRDFAVLMIEAVRAPGFAARFVSGYLYVLQRTTPGQAPAWAGGSAAQAWLRVCIPGAGWVEKDPTNGIVGNRDLSRVAVTRDHRHAVPLHGTRTGLPAASLGMTVGISVNAAEPEAISVT